MEDSLRVKAVEADRVVAREIVIGDPAGSHITACPIEGGVGLWVTAASGACVAVYATSKEVVAGFWSKKPGEGPGMDLAVASGENGPVIQVIKDGVVRQIGADKLTSIE